MSDEQDGSSKDATHSSSTRSGLVIIAVAVLVLAVCLALVSLCLATMYAASWDPCSWMGAVILMPLPTYLVLQQYRAVFRGNANAAFRSSLILCLVGGFALFAFVMTFGELVMASIPIPWRSLLVPMLLFAFMTLGTAVVNFRWFRRLKRDAPPGGDLATPSGLWRRDLIAGLLSIIFVSSVTSYYVNKIPPRCAEHVSVDDAPFGLPESAKDVTFCQGSRGMIAYEFTIDEPGFVEWVESGIGSLESEAANIPVKAITEPFTVTRYGSLSPDREDPELATIEEGLYYQWSKEDRAVYAVFDRSSSRAYYYAHYH